MNFRALLLSFITIITYSLNAQTGNVGIGTSSPDTTLHIVGNIKIEDGNQASSKVLTSNADGVASWQNFVELDPKILVDSLNIVPKWDGTNLINGTMIDDGTNIGIGVLNPTFKLQVSEDIKVNGILIGKGLANHNSNLVVGLNALKLNTAGLGNSAFGDQSLESSNANFNTGFGYRTLWKTTTGRQNTAVGNSAVGSNVLGSDNVGIGNQALGKTLESRNTGVGAGAMSELSTGSNNTVVGYSALSNNINGDNNTAIGNEAGQNNKGSLNVFIGNEAGKNDTTSNKLYIANSSTDEPLIYGDFAMDSVKINGVLTVSEDANIAGVTVGNGPSNNANNTVVGREAFASNVIGTANSAFGTLALHNSTGSNNSAFGYTALFNNDSGSFNTAFGSYALQKNVSGDNNVAFGHFSLTKSIADRNTAIGVGAMAFSETGENNVAVGMSAIANNNFGEDNTAIGFQAGFRNEGSGNVFIGMNAGHFEDGSNKLYIDNSDTIKPLIYGDFADDSVRINGILSIGYHYSFPNTDGASGQLLSTDGNGNLSWIDSLTEIDPTIIADSLNIVPRWDGTNLVNGTMIDNGTNVGIGVPNPSAKLEVSEDIKVNNLTIGKGNGGILTNVALGIESLKNTTGIGGDNVGVGYFALKANTTGHRNTGVGFEALLANQTGEHNTAIGWRALSSSKGNSNSAIGESSLQSLDGGNNNVGIGYRSLLNNETGNTNVAVGNSAGHDALGSGNVFLGHAAGFFETGSNTLYIDNSNTTDPLIYGDFDNDALHIHGTMNISETLKLEPLATAPGCGVGDEGLMYFDDSLKKLRVCDGTAWQNLH